MCFVNVESVDRIIYSIFQRLIWNGKPAPSTYLHKLLDVTPVRKCLTRRSQADILKSKRLVATQLQVPKTKEFQWYKHSS